MFELRHLALAECDFGVFDDHQLRVFAQFRLLETLQHRLRMLRVGIDLCRRRGRRRHRARRNGCRDRKRRARRRAAARGADAARARRPRAGPDLTRRAPALRQGSPACRQASTRGLRPVPWRSQAGPARDETEPNATASYGFCTYSLIKRTFHTEASCSRAWSGTNLEQLAVARIAGRQARCIRARLRVVGMILKELQGLATDARP